jgi:hypothetical protein
MVDEEEELICNLGQYLHLGCVRVECNGQDCLVEVSELEESLLCYSVLPFLEVN